MYVRMYVQYMYVGIMYERSRFKNARELEPGHPCKLKYTFPYWVSWVPGIVIIACLIMLYNYSRNEATLAVNLMTVITTCVYHCHQNPHFHAVRVYIYCIYIKKSAFCLHASLFGGAFGYSKCVTAASDTYL